MEPQQPQNNPYAEQAKREEDMSESEFDKDSSSSSSDIEYNEEPSLFGNKYQFKLAPDIYYITKHIERERLETKLGDRASINFKPNRILEVHYADNNIKEEIRKFIYGMIDVPFEFKQRSKQGDILRHCKMLKEELKLSQFQIFKADKQIFLYGINKKKEQVVEKKQQIISNYIEVKHTQKPLFRRAERIAYLTIFERLRNFDKFIKNMDGIIKIQPYFKTENKFHFKGKKKSLQWSLKFFVKCSKKIDANKVDQGISNEIATCRYITLIIDKQHPNLQSAPKSKKYALSYDHNKKEQYLIFAFRKQELDPRNILGLLRDICESIHVSILGYRYFLGALDKKINLADVDQKATQLGFNYECWPKEKPYSFTLKRKLTEQSLTDSQMFLVELAVYGKIKVQKVNTSNILQQISLTNIRQINSVTTDPSTDNCDVLSMAIKLAEEEPMNQDKGANDKFFIQKIKQRTKENIDDFFYSKTPIECTKAFKELYEGIKEPEERAIATGIPINLLSKSICEVYNDDIQLIPLNQLKGKKNYLIGFYKPQAFSNTAQKYAAFRPEFKMQCLGKVSKLASSVEGNL